MLNFVFGRAGYGKTEYTFNRISSLIDTTDADILLFTPEQYSFVAERKLLTLLGENKLSRVKNLSFSRLNDEINELYGKPALTPLSKGVKNIIMSQAVNNSKEKLQLFNDRLDTLSFVSSMISVYDEMRSCNLASTEISALTDGIENELLRLKLKDISTIMAEYERLIRDKYIDSADELSILYNRLNGKRYFADKYIFIDGFNGFVAQEYKLLELMINEGKEVYITLCTDSFEKDEQFDLFSYVNNTARIIKRIADKSKVDTNFITLDENHRAKNDELRFVEKHIFSPNSATVKNCGAVRVYNAKTVSDECNHLSVEIKKLLRSGYKASEITVITRSLDKYKNELAASFKLYGVPFFFDEREPIKTQPLLLLICYVMRCVIYSYRSDDILSLAKTGLIDIDEAAVNKLENYVYLWNINGAKWKKPFENSTKGFVGELSDSDRAELDEINSTRERLINPLLSFAKAAKTKDSKTICESIYNTVIRYKADEMLRLKAISLSKQGLTALAQEQGRIWELTMELLNQMAGAIDGEIDLKSFAGLFELMVSSEDLGSVPVGIDNVQLGQADRLRADNPRAVFIIGANEDEFPKAVTDNGLLSESDRRIMLENDFKLYSYGEILNFQERYFAYMAMSSACEKLYVSYISSGNTSSPSEIVTELQAIVEDLKTEDISGAEPLDYVETGSSAFNLMSERFFLNDEFSASLKKYFYNDPRYNGVKSLAENTTHKIFDKDNATKLFDYNMKVSASKLEDYYKCAFRYFCKFGLGVKPRAKAEIDPLQRGTIIHDVLENLISDVGTKKLTKMSDTEIRALVDKYIKRYFDANMSASGEVTSRFKYNYSRLSNLVYNVVIRLSLEFANCDFEAKAFEMSIDTDGEVKPQVLTLDDNGTIQIRGSIDRVDTFDLDGERYVRVVDYKTGVKEFKLQDILAGLNLQMFVYLFTLCNDKTASLSGIPAGVLYMHASSKNMSLDSRLSLEKDVSDGLDKQFKMEGIVLHDDEAKIPEAMEHLLEGRFIPVKYTTKGDITGDLATLEELGLISKKIDKLIIEMGNELHNGNIEQNPVKSPTHKETCEYCDFRDICSNSRIIVDKEFDSMSNKQVLSALREEFSDDETELDATTE